MKAAFTTLALSVTSLLALGLVMLYSASWMMVDRHTHSEVGARMLQMQVVWGVLGCIACVAVASLDTEFIRKYAWVAFAATLVLAGLVFVPHVGLQLNGARRWIRLPGATFQPSEFVKLGLIVMLAWYGALSQRKMDTFKRGVLVPLLIIGAALGLVFIEPDRGTTILLGGVSLTMLWIAGTRFPYLVLIVVLGAAGFACSLRHDSMRNGRLSAWLHPEAHMDGAARQAEEAKIAIGSGGLTGQGLGDGRQKQGFVSEIHSDFIFANIGEELGLAATLPVVGAFLLIALSGWYVALQARDQFGCLLAVGVTSLISYQAIFNLGVVMSLLPNKGLALPFISAGGSSLLAMLIGVGLLFSVARQATPARIAASDIVSDDNPFAAKAA
jgi:cell division protein FtsW